MSKWKPVTGDNASFWDPDSEIFLDEVDSSDNYTNPLLDTISAGRIGDAQYLIELLFEDELDYGFLSYVMAYSPSGERIYCGSALDLLGVDPCSPAARPDFFSYLDSFIEEASTRPRQSVVKIKDKNKEQESTLNLALSFPINIEGQTLAVITLGVDIRKGLEVFEDEFEVRSAINTESGLISLNDYYQQFGNTEDNLFDIENFNKLTDKAIIFKELNGSRHSEKDKELGASITLLPLSTSLSADEAQLFIFKDERVNISRVSDVEELTYVVAISFVILIISLIAFITTRTFGGITKAIEVLEGLTKGDHTQEMPVRKGILSSETDEVGQLSAALGSYKSHLIEMNSIREEQAKRRHERDEVIIEKMTALADQLDGSARTLILNDINETRSKTQTLKESLKGRADILDRTIIRSPIEGTVNQIHTSTIGGVIKPGEVIIEIVPLGSEIVIEAKVLPSDIGFIGNGMRSRIKLSSYDFSIFGDLEGSVKLVSADSIQDDKGNIFYKVKVKPDNDFISWKNEKLPLMIGMTGSIDIITSKRTIFSYISSPVTKTFMSAFREK